MKLQILHTNDMHNCFPGETLEKIRQPGALVLDSGDALAGSNTVFHFHEPILDKMRDFGYHAMAMGNREFHYLRGVLQRRFEAAGFPIVSANVVDLRKQLSVVDSLMFTIDGLKIGLFALTVPQYPVNSTWEMITGWRFFDPVEVAREIPGRLRRKGADLVFCLSHLGFLADQKLAEEAPEMDVIFGGHSHTVLPNVIWGEKTAIVQTGSHGRFVGNYTLEVVLSGSSVKFWTLEGGLVPTS